METLAYLVVNAFFRKKINTKVPAIFLDIQYLLDNDLDRDLERERNFKFSYILMLNVLGVNFQKLFITFIRPSKCIVTLGLTLTMT